MPIILKIGHTKVKNIQFLNSEEIRRRDSEEMPKTCKEKRMPHFFSQMLRGQSHKQVNLISRIKLLNIIEKRSKEPATLISFIVKQEKLK